MAKAKKSSEEEEIVFAFLTKQNRPFSVQNLVDSLQKDGVKKAAVERSLASLVQKGRVTKKEYGKAKIFILAQDQLELPDPTELAALEEELRALGADLAALEGRVAEKGRTVGDLRLQLTLEGARARSAELKGELGGKEAKLSLLGDGSKLITKEDKVKIEQSYYDLRVLWKKYKRTVTDIVNQIGEATGKKNSELYEDIGIETDEAANVKITDFPDIPNPAKAKRGTLQGRNVKRQRQK